MPSMLALTLLVVVLLWFVLGVLRAFIRAWLDHRTRVAALETGAEVPSSSASNENYVVTGALLAAFGVGAVATGWYLGHGETAVGVYAAGFIALVMGVLIALLGVVLKGLTTTADAGESSAD